MPDRSPQLRLDLTADRSDGRDSFIAAPSNELARSMLEDAATWPQAKLVLVGPKSSGKSHLAGIWAADSGAQVVSALQLSDLSLDFSRPLVIEDIDRIAGQPALETALFHVFNAIGATPYPLLMTSRSAPARLPFGLPDLRSRLEATALVSITEPDDALVSMLLVKLFADRGISVSPGTVSYVQERIEYSFAKLNRFVARMDDRAITEARKINKALAREVLAELSVS